MTKFNRTSDMCVCGHHLSHHYRKNFLVRGRSSHSLGVQYGNVDFHGCVGCESEGKQCKTFIHAKVPKHFHYFEQGFRWELSDLGGHPGLLKIYDEEIVGPDKQTHITDPINWILKNEARYVKMLQDEGVVIGYDPPCNIGQEDECEYVDHSDIPGMIDTCFHPEHPEIGEGGPRHGWIGYKCPRLPEMVSGRCSKT